MGKRQNNKKQTNKTNTPEASFTKKAENPPQPPGLSNQENWWKVIASVTCFGLMGLLGFYVGPQLLKITEHSETLAHLTQSKEFKPLFDNYQDLKIKKTLEKADASNKALKALCDSIVAEEKRLPKNFAAVEACKEIAKTANALFVENDLLRRADDGAIEAVKSVSPETNSTLDQAPKAVKAAQEVRRTNLQKKAVPSKKKPRVPNAEGERAPAQN